MNNETELKLELASDDRAALVQSAILPGAPRRLHLRTVYFDTPKRHLWRAGVTLRIRHSGGKRIQTVKAAGSGAAGVFVRTEWERPVTCDWPIPDETAELKALLADYWHDVAPAFEVRVERLVWDVKWEKSQIEAAIDTGEIIAGERRSDICELELELKAGKPVALFTLARCIDAVAAVRIGVLDKPERGFRLIGPLASHWKDEAVVLPEACTHAAAFKVIAQSCIRQFRLNEPLIGRPHPEALHQARVGLRRLRSAFSVFGRYFTDAEFKRLASEVKWLANVLGPVRDLDVIAAGNDLDDADRRRLNKALDAGYLKAANDLGSARARAVMLDLCAWMVLENGDARGNVAPLHDVRDFAVETLNRYRRKVRKRGKRLVDLDHGARHELRKDARKLRHSADFFVSLFPGRKKRKRAQRFIRSLNTLQDQLGRLNDLAAGPDALKAAGLAEVATRREYDEVQRREWLEEAAGTYDVVIGMKPFWH
ncbi:MAG: CYTH and CHAD domain-containing protein [Glycocaulis sp.]